MKEACIFNMQRYSLHDGGGIRTVVFFKGCPFTCPWCSNPESLQASPQIIHKASLCIHCSDQNGPCDTPYNECPTGAKQRIGEMISVEAVFDTIKRDRIFYDSSQGGITLSGGECLTQSEFVIALLEKCQEEGIHTAIETTLALPISQWESIVKSCDLFLVDFKIFDEQESLQMLGITLSLMKANVKAILKLGAKVIPRIPLIPKVTTTKANLDAIIQFLQEVQLKEIHLLPFHQLGQGKYEAMNMKYAYQDIKTLDDNEIDYIEQYFKKEGFITVIHGT